MALTDAEGLGARSPDPSQVRLVLTFKLEGLGHTRMAENIMLDGCGGLIVDHGNRKERLVLEEMSDIRIHPVREIPFSEHSCLSRAAGIGE